MIAMNQDQMVSNATGLSLPQQLNQMMEFANGITLDHLLLEPFQLLTHAL
jgi:hypothetical protein